MLFNTLAYPAFLLLVLLLHWWLAGSRSRNALLLAASYVFYGWWDWRFLGLILLSSGVDYLCGRGLETAARPARRRRLLAASLGTNLAILGTFKYLDFFAGSAAALLQGLGLRASWVALELALPVGISFYTFQTMAYTIDVYRGRRRACRDPLTFFLFVAFFPQLVAGPIERAGDLIPQLERPRRFDEALARAGLRHILWGYVLKCVVADNLAPMVDAVWAAPARYSAGDIVLSVWGFAFQIYGDFAGYSSIAIGSAALLGVRLTENFRSPYLSGSVAEFWRRWHVSLATWFRDYVYLPLGGRRVPPGRRVLNVLATFALSGLWHGASWSFVAWGGLNGLLYFLRPPVPGPSRTARALNALLTFHLVCLGWVLFRAPDLATAAGVLGRIASGAGAAGATPLSVAPLAGAALVLVVELARHRRGGPADLSDLSPGLRRVAFAAAVLLLFFTGAFDRQPFIYYRF